MNITKIILLLCICFSIVIITQQECPDMHYTSPKSPKRSDLPETAPSSNCTPTDQTNRDISAEKADTKTSSRTIKVTNNITKKMLAYTKGFIQYTPDFTLYINNMPIEPGKQQQIMIENNSLIVGYTYNFANGYKKGSKEIEFMIPITKDELEVRFSWHDDWRVIISGAPPQRIISEVN